jgi:hypothetical protein
MEKVEEAEAGAQATSTVDQTRPQSPGSLKPSTRSIPRAAHKPRCLAFGMWFKPSAGLIVVECRAGGNDGAGCKMEPSALLKEATMIVAGLQELVARASIFLPAYDQRLSSDIVVSLHDAIAKARRRVCPKPAFSFKTRKAPPEPLAALIAQVRREVGTTSGEEHLQVQPSPSLPPFRPALTQNMHTEPAFPGNPS